MKKVPEIDLDENLSSGSIANDKEDQLERIESFKELNNEMF